MTNPEDLELWRLRNQALGRRSSSGSERPSLSETSSDGTGEPGAASQQGPQQRPGCEYNAPVRHPGTATHPKPMRWWQRYLIGVGLIASAIYMPSLPGKEWVPVVMAILAFFFMYEFLIIGIFGLIGYVMFGAIAALPTSVAIIIGAWIIASSRSK
jgi:hypothetical protein